MATLEAAPARRGAPQQLVLAGFLAALAVVALARLGGLADQPAVQTFAVIFTAIVVEALPFVLLGAAVSALIEVFVSDRAFNRLAGLPVPLQLPLAAFGGFAFPVCECGSVPGARRLIGRGLHPTAGLAFMLASPFFNPIVLASTWIAYSSRGVAVEMVLGRALLGLVLALATGWALGGEGAREILRGREEHDHGHEDAPAAPRWQAFTDHLAGDFFFMGKFLVVGAGVAAGLQTLLPQSLVSGVARTPVVGALALMGVAFVASLCSEADAFVAVSFTQFPLGSQLAFLVFGPVVDLKLAFLYTASFRRRFVLRLVTVAAPVVLAGSLVFEVILR